MNKVYRVIWNESLGAWVAVSEITKSKGKKSNKAIKSGVLVSSLVLFAGNAIAASYVGGNATATGAESVAIGDGAKSLGDRSVALGTDSFAQNKYANALGESAKALGDDSAAVGTRAEARANYSTALGNEAIAEKEYDLAVGYQTKASGEQSTAVGFRSRSTGKASNAIGGSSLAAGEYSTAVGQEAHAEGDYSIALGLQSKTAAGNQFATALGYKANASGQSSFAQGAFAEAIGGGSIAMGDASKAADNDTIAIGTRAQATGEQSISVGKGNVVSGDNSGAFGNPTTISGTGSYGVGNNNTIATNDTFVVGNNVTATKENSVYLGTDAAYTAKGASTDGDAAVTAPVTVGGTLTYGGFAGKTPVGVVSVGADGKERRIQNMAAGLISEKSTDAINGSQLYATNEVLGNVANTTKNILGGNADLKPDGSLTMTNIGDTGYNTVHEAIKASKEEVVAGTNIASVTPSKGANGQTIYTVNAKGTTASAGSSAVTVTAGTPDANNVTDYAVDLSQDTKDKIDGALQTVVTQIDGATVKTITKSNNTANFVTGKNIVLSDDGAGGIAVATKDDVTFTNVNTTNLNTTGVTNLGGTTNITGDAYYTGPITKGDNIVNKTYVDKSVTTLANNPLTFAGDTGANVERKLGETLNIVGGKTGTLTDGNIGVVANGSDTLTVKLASDLAGLNSVSIVGGPTINNTGINMGGDKITNLAAGDVNSTSTDAVNGSQLYAVSEVANKGHNVTTAAMGTGTVKGTTVTNVAPGDTVTYTAGNNIEVTQNGKEIQIATSLTPTFTTVNTTNLNTTGVTNLGGTTNITGDAYYTGPITKGDNIVNKTYVDNSITTLANNPLTFAGDTGSAIAKKLGETLTISGKLAAAADATGANLRVDSADGKLNLVMAQDLTDLKSITINGGPTINGSGINMGGDKITNLAKGDVSSTSTDAVNGSQLYAVSEVANAGWNIATDSGTAAASNVKPDGTATFNGDGENIAVTNVGNTVTVALTKDINVDSITLNGKNGKDGISITGAVGAPGVNGTNGITRIIYEDPTTGKPTEVATLNDGLKFAGNTGDVIAKKLNETLSIEGKLAAAADSTGANLRVDSADGKLNLVMAKDLTDLNSITINGGPTINGNGIDMNGDKITNLAPGVDATDAVNVSQLEKAANNLVTTGFNIADGKGGKDNVKLGETVTFTDPAGNIITTVTDNKVEFGLNSTLSVGKDGDPGKVGIKGADGKDAISLNGKDGTIGINGKNGANATLTVEKAKPALDGKDGQNGENGQTRIVYTKPNGSKEEVATLNDGLNFKADDGSIVAKKLNETLEIVGGADKDKLTDNNIGVNNKNGKLTVQLAKDININSVKFGDNGPTIKADASNNINIAKSDGSATKITNVEAGTGDKDAVNVSQLKAAKSTVDGDKGVSVTPKTNADGSTTYTVAAKTDGTTTKIDNNGNIAAVTTTFTPSTDGKVGAPVGKGNSLVTANTVANAINNSGWKLAADGTTGTELINPSDTVTFKTDSSNLTVKRDGANITYDLAKDININSVQFNNGPKITNDGNNIKIGDKDGNATKITNVAAGVDATDAVNVSQLEKAANNLVTTGFNIADGKGGKDNVKLGETVTFTDPAGNIITTVTDNKVEFGLNSTLSVGKDGDPGKVGIKGADGKDAISLNGKDGTIGINGKNGANATLTVEKAKPALDGKDGQNGENGQTRIVYTKPNGSKEEVATLNDGLNFKADDGSIVAKKLNETLEIVGGADKDKLTDNNIGVNNKNGKLTVQLAKDININSVKFGDNGPTIKADASNNINIAKSDGSATKITNVEAGTGDKDAVNVSQLKAAKSTVDGDKGVSVTPKTNADGSTTYTVAAKTDGTTTKIDNNGNIAAVTTTFTPSTDGKVGAPVGKGNSLVTANTVANAINNSGWKLAADGTTGTELINPSDTVTFKTDSSNLTVKRDGANITYDLAKDININSVQFNNGPKITNDGNNIKIGDKDGNATKITNVAAGVDATDAVNVSQLEKAANNLVTTGFNIADGKGGKDNVKLGETVTFTDPAGNIITTVTDNKVEFGLNSTLSVGKDGDPGKVGIKGADGKDAISLNGKDGTIGLKGADGKDGISLNGKDGTIGINGKDGANATLTVEKAKPALDGKDGQNGENSQTRIVYTKPNGSKEEVATLNDGLNFKADDGSIVAKKLNETLDITGGADKDSLTDNNIGVNNKDGKLTVQLAKDININSVKFGDNGPTIKADASNNINIAKSDGSATKITNVEAGTGDNDAVNVSQLEKAQAAATTKVEGDKGVSVTPKTNTDGSTTYTVAAKTDNTTVKVDDKGNIAAVTAPLTTNTDGKVNTPAAPNALATAGDIANAINNSGWKATSGATGSGVVNGTTEELINPSETVTFQAGDNMVLNQAGNVFTYSLNKDININSVQFNDGPTIKADASNNINIAKSDGSATKITNVAAGTGDNDAVNVSQLKEAANNLVTTGFNIADGKGGKDNVKLGETVTFTDPAGNIITTVTDNKVEFGLNSTLSVGKDGEPGKVGIKGADGKDAISLNGKDGTIGLKGADGKDGISLNGKDGTIGINGKNGANATLTVEKAKPALDGKDGQNGENGQTRIVYTKPNGSKEEVATLNDGLNFKADDGSIVAKKLNETLEIVGGADKDSLTDNNIGVNNKNGKLTVQLAKDININSVKFGDNGPTIKADASNNINIAKSDGSATKITNVKAGEADTDAVNVSQLEKAQAAATTKVEEADGIKVVPTKNADGSTTYTVSAKTDGTTTTINADGKIAAVTTTFKPSTDGKVGAPVGNGDSLVTANTVADAINNSGWKATSGATGSGVVNGTTEELINPSETVTFRAGDNMVLNQAENVFTYSLNKDININSVQFNNGPKITNDGNNIKIGDKDGNATKITNVAAGTGDKDAVNVSQLKAVEATANKGWNLTTNGKPESKSNVKPGDTVDFANEDGNVKIENKGNNVIVNLNKDIDLTKDGSVTIGDTKVNNDGLTIAGGPSVTKSGIDAGDKKITNVAPGKISADSKDAINGSQLYTVQQAAVAAKTEVKAGDNVEVKKESGGNGQDIYTVSAKDTSASVTAGSTAVAVTKGATTKVGTTDVTDYKVDLSQSAKDDIKKGVDAKDIVDNKGLTFAGDSGSTSVQKLGSTVNVKGDKNITTKASGNTVEVALNPNVTVDSVTATQAVNVGSGGAQVALTTNVGKDGVRELSVGSANAPTRITNVARGVNDTDAVNLSQLKDLGYNINTKIDKVEKEANAGIASAMAMETAPFIAGKWTYAVGAAYYGGEQAVGATLRKTADNGRWSLTGGVATGTEGDPSVRIGISGVID